MKTPHKTFCDYEVTKANKIQQIKTYSNTVTRKPLGIKTHNCSKAELAQRLYALI